MVFINVMISLKNNIRLMEIYRRSKLGNHVFYNSDPAYDQDKY